MGTLNTSPREELSGANERKSRTKGACVYMCEHMYVCAHTCVYIQLN